MKIDKIQCDICGKIVDYNSKRIRNMIQNGYYFGSEDEGKPYYSLKYNTNNFNAYGITKIKNIDKNINPACANNEDVIIKMNFDLCEDCLIELYKMINKYIKEVRE